MKNLLKIIVFTAFLVSLTNCKKPDNNDPDCSFIHNLVHDPSACIVGKWQLVKVYQTENSQIPTCVDYSHFNIFFEFCPNGFVDISGQISGAGTHRYTFHDDVWGEGFDGFSYGLEITLNGTFWYKITSNAMVLNRWVKPTSRGTTSYFVRIN